MKRPICLLLALLICASLLCGCGQEPSIPLFATPSPVPEAEVTPEPTPEPTEKPQVEPTDEREGMWELIPFDEMPYERPDTEELRAAVEAVGEALDSGADYETVEPLLDACDELYTAFDTMYSIAFIRSCQDMTDEFYADEYAVLDEACADVNQIIEDLYYRCGMSDMAQELEEKYFWPGFAEEYADRSTAFYVDEMVELLQNESSLVAEYRALVASPTVVLGNGSEVDFFDSLESFTGYAYLDLLTRYYDQYNEQLGRIYVDLIKNRQLQAKQAGYDSYEALAFDHGFGRDYSPEQAEEYLQGISDVIVPLYKRVLAADPFGTRADDELSAERLEEILRFGVKDMGAEVQDTYEFMVKYRLCDIVHSPLKAEMSFETYLSAYEVPFLFMDATGTLSDITTFSHEFGHYLDGYLNCDEEETVDLAECFSQAMEFLMLTRLDEVLSEEELDALTKEKMTDVLGMYVQQGAFAEFEHIVYAADPDELTPEFLNSSFLQMSQKYGFCERGFEDLYSKFWMDITHFFEQPFYIITYPVSHDIAMQIFQLEREEPGAGLEKFMTMLPREYPDMLDTALNAGLDSPFDPGRLDKVAETMAEILLGESQKKAA